MPDEISKWEKEFSEAIRCIAPASRGKAGALLPVIPTHLKWDEYLSTIKSEWEILSCNLQRYPASLVLLYDGLAFYEYEDKELWPQFVKATGKQHIPQNQRNGINAAFADAIKQFGLTLKSRSNGTDFIGSAVYHIGIPLSLWDGFLDICKWAIWREDWQNLSSDEWDEAVEKRSGSRQRLKRFMIENRESATSFVKDMLDARKILAAEQSLTINDLAQASILRLEYFDEIPETAEFLRPQNPESLFQDRARLVWNEQQRQICLQLPAVSRERLPATWYVGAKSQHAAQNPDELILNSAAFHNPLLLKLAAGKHYEVQRLRGLDSWGLFDTESGGRFANQNRDELPLKSYVLISRGEIDIFSREGFDEDENPANEPFELSDGTTCFITRLWPTGKLAELKIRERNDATKTIRFKTRATIEARFFIGKGEKAAFFERIEKDFVKIESWPILCVSIPDGYFRDNKTELDTTFKVYIDDKLAGGRWEQSDGQKDNDREFYFWVWVSNRPVTEQVKSGTVKSFQELRTFYSASSPKGNMVLAIKSPEFCHHYKIDKVDPKSGMGKCWTNLPGAFYPMFLLCKSTEGLKWEDLLLAKDVIAPNQNQRFLAYVLHKYANHGILVQRGQRWFIGESRAQFLPLDRDQCHMHYCGDPSILWCLYRRMYHEMKGSELPTIEISDRRGEIPYLKMLWRACFRSELEKYLKHHGVKIGAILWNH
jgi:hypothetical protein